MADNYKRDGLEEFFRRRLEGFEEAPKAEMWDKISFNIPPKPPIPWWQKPIWWAMGTVVVGLSVFLWQFYQIQVYKAVVIRQDKELSALKLAKTEEKNTARLTGIQQLPRDDEKLTQSVLQTENGNTVAIPDERVMERKEPRAVVVKKENTTPATTPKQENEPISVVDRDRSTQPKGQSPYKETMVMSVSNKIPSGNGRLLSIPMPFLPQQSGQEVEDKKGFYLGVQAGWMRASFGNVFSSEEAGTNGVVTSLRSSNINRFQGEILSGLQLNRKWSVELGIGLRQNVIDFYDNRTISYSDEVFDMVNLQGEPTGIVAPATSPPHIAYELVNHVQNDGEDIGLGDEFKITSSYTNEIQFLSIPAWVKYRLGNHRLHGYLKTGISWNILSGSYYRIGIPNISFDRIDWEGTNITNDGIREIYFEWGAVIGLEFDMSLQHSIGLEGGYYRTLSSVVGNTQESFGLSIGYKYAFK